MSGVKILTRKGRQCRNTSKCGDWIAKHWRCLTTQYEKGIQRPSAMLPNIIESNNIMKERAAHYGLHTAFIYRHATDTYETSMTRIPIASATTCNFPTSTALPDDGLVPVPVAPALVVAVPAGVVVCAPPPPPPVPLAAIAV